MLKQITALGGALLFSVVATPALAATVVDGKCTSVTADAGCLFDGNINSSSSGNNSYTNAQNAYNAYNNTHPSANPDISLTALGASDDAGFKKIGSITGAGTSAGTWTLNGFVASFLSVKAGNNFVLYQLATPASSGTWDTFDLPYKNNPPALSHLVFFGQAATGAVPEPATWAMMILGMGAVGFAMRRRRKNVTTTVAYAA
jgi:hypothetical protein